MCFDHDSRPPIPPIAGGALDAHEVALDAGDGNHFAAYLARAAEPTGAGIVIHPDVRGLHAYYEDLALRFAEHGIDAIAFDYFGRTAGIGDRGIAFEYQEHVPRLTFDGLRADGIASIDHLRAATGVGRVFTVGFCMGGRVSWLAAASGHGLAGAIGFYGRPGESRDGLPGPTQLAAQIEAPVLALQAGADANITAEDNEAFDRALTDAGVEHEVVTYDGAPHSFFDRKQEEFVAASEDAWGRVLEFIGRQVAR